MATLYQAQRIKQSAAFTMKKGLERQSACILLARLLLLHIHLNSANQRIELLTKP